MRLIILFFCLLISCSAKEGEDPWKSPGKVRILATTAMVGDLVKGVGGPFIDLKVLIKGELDPHSYQLVKGDSEKFGAADLIFFNGLGLEHGPSLRQHLENSPKAISLGDFIAVKNPDAILYIGGQIDPHIWMDYALFSEAIPLIVEELSKKDPQHAEEFKNNGEALKKELLALHEKVRATLQSVPDEKRYLVTSHDAFNYFTRAYLATDEERRLKTWKERFNAPEGLAPESQLSLTHIASILSYIQKYRVRVVFPESNVSRDSLEKLVDSGLKMGLVVRLSSETLFGDAMAGSYKEMLLLNSERIKKELLNE